MTDQEKMQIAREIMVAWSRSDMDRVADTFHEDGVLHSVMKEPRKGRESVRRHIKSVASTKPGNSVQINIKHIGVVDGLVFVERVDRLTVNGVTADVPAVGVLEIEAGKVKSWLDYYDRETMLRASQGLNVN